MALLASSIFAVVAGMAKAKGQNKAAHRRNRGMGMGSMSSFIDSPISLANETKNEDHHSKTNWIKLASSLKQVLLWLTQKLPLQSKAISESTD